MIINKIIDKYGFKIDEEFIDENHKIFEGINESRKSHFVSILIGKGLLKKDKNGKLKLTAKGKAKGAIDKIKNKFKRKGKKKNEKK